MLSERSGRMTQDNNTPPTGAAERMNSADPASKNTAGKVQQGSTTLNPKAKVPSDLYPDPPGVTDETKGAPDN